jgi:hypothetical protein
MIMPLYWLHSNENASKMQQKCIIGIYGPNMTLCEVKNKMYSPTVVVEYPRRRSCQKTSVPNNHDVKPLLVHTIINI